MRTSNILLYFCLLLACVIQVDSFVDPLSIAAASAIMGLLAYVYKNPESPSRIVEYACQKAGFCEGCEDFWIPGNLQALEFDLNSQVFGQPLAIELVLTNLKKHLDKENPSKALVLSFHGSPGTGKSFVSNKILKNMFKNGDSSKYVNFFRSSIDFPSKEESRVEYYKAALAQTIMEKVRSCHRSVFVFDEVEKMPNGILDVLSAFVQAKTIKNVNFRRVIFILLSNVGASALNNEVLRDIQYRNTRREDISISKLTHLLAEEAYNRDGGLSHTNLVKNHDVTAYVPFLPLERHHVVECLQVYVVKKRNQVMSKELAELVINDIVFNDGIFSSPGCKKVEELAAFYIERELRNKRRLERGN